MPTEPTRRADLAACAAASSFYHLRDIAVADRACAGLACFAARQDDPARWLQAQAEPRVYCLGRCHAAPAHGGDDVRPRVEVQAREPVLLERIRAGGAGTLARYLALGGGVALQRALAQPPGEVLAQVEASELRGRGGAGFPTGAKWLAVARQTASCKYVVANADEGDPGAFSDRLLMEEDPFRLIEGLRIAAHAVGACAGVIYLRCEYPAAASSLRRALTEARGAGWLGADFDLTLHIGEGSYLAGEETAMLNAIEGRRPEVRVKPPQIFERGLFGAPTLVNNVETLCSIPWIVENGARRYAALGFSHSRGTKLLSLSSLFRRAGLYEVEFGITLRDIVERLGGGLRRGTLRGLMVGGPLAGLLPPTQLDVALGFEEMQAVGGAVGHGGVIAFGDDTSIRDIAAELFRFGADESCGKCVPCHLGVPLLARRFSPEQGDRPEGPREFDALVEALAATSLCGHGRGLAEFAQSLKRYFPDEVAACLR